MVAWLAQLMHTYASCIYEKQYYNVVCLSVCAQYNAIYRFCHDCVTSGKAEKKENRIVVLHTLVHASSNGRRQIENWLNCTINLCRQEMPLKQQKQQQQQQQQLQRTVVCRRVSAETA